jgi:hypothetical protein
MATAHYDNVRPDANELDYALELSPSSAMRIVPVAANPTEYDQDFTVGRDPGRHLFDKLRGDVARGV